MEELYEILYEKITYELEQFKRKMLREEPEVIYGSAFEIDSYINIFEVLSEMISEKTIRRELLITLISRKNLLKELYTFWLKTEDSSWKELSRCICNRIKEMEHVVLLKRGGGLM